MLSLSGNKPVFNTFFINSIGGFIIESSISFNSLEEMPLNPQRFFLCEEICNGSLHSFFVNIFKCKNGVDLFI